jgi:hypothetical protein
MFILSDHREMDTPFETKKIATGYFRLDRKTMLDMLKNETVILFDIEYITPETQLLEYLQNHAVGELKLTLEAK